MMAGCVVALGATLFSGNSAAEAIDAVSLVQPGLMCRYYGPMADDHYFNPSGLSANGLKNTSSSSKYVACPIVKWDGASKEVFLDYNTRYAAIEGDFSNADACKFYMRRLGSFGYYNAAGVENRGGGYYRHKWGHIGTANYSVSLYCDVPAQKSILFYFHKATFL